LANEHRQYLKVLARPEIVTLATALLFLLLAYLPFLTGSKDYVIGDCQLTYQPVCQFINAWLKRGILPLWNPHIYCGFPEIAVTSPGFFYPPNYILFLLPFSQGLALYLLLHQFIAGLAAYGLVVRKLENKDAALFAAISVMFCGYMFGMHKYPDFVASVCMLICCFWSTGEFFAAATTQKAQHFAALCCFSALLFAAGRPEIFIPGGFFVLVQALCETYQHNRNGTPKRELIEPLAFWALAFACAALMACPMIIPAAEWTPLSPRSRGIDLEQAFKWSTYWFDWLQLVFFRPFGDLDQSGQLNGALNFMLIQHKIELPFLPASFLGPGFFTAFCLGIADHSCKQRNILLWLCLLGVLICAGDQTPVAPLLLKSFPKLVLFRYPIKDLIMPILPAIFLAAAGIRWILVKENKSQRAIYAALASWLIIALAGPLLFYSGSLAHLIESLCHACGTTITDAAESTLLQTQMLHSFIMTGLFGSGFCLIAALFRSNTLSKAVAAVALLALYAVPMIIYDVDMKEKAADGGYYVKTAWLDKLMQQCSSASQNPEQQQSRIAYLIEQNTSLPLNYSRDSKLPWFLAYMTYARDVMLADTHMTTRWNYANGYSLAETSQVMSLFRAANSKSSLHSVELKNDSFSDYPLARFCSFSNSNFVVTPKNINTGQVGADAPRLSPELFTLIHEDNLYNTRVYELKEKASRFYFASRIDFPGSWQHLSEEMLAPENKSIYADQITYLSYGNIKDISDQLQGAPNKAPTARAAKAAWIKVLKDEPDCVALRLQKSSPGILVMRDQYYPGWRAYVDGHEQQILRANCFNRAIFVPAGQHLVEFFYRPQSLKLGLSLAALGFLAAAILWVVLHFKGKNNSISLPLIAAGERLSPGDPSTLA